MDLVCGRTGEGRLGPASWGWPFSGIAPREVGLSRNGRGKKTGFFSDKSK